MSLRVVFMGSPDFAVPSLEAVVAAGHEVACVYAQPPRPAGRGHKERPCPVHAAAVAKGIEVRTPANLKDPADRAAFADLGADLAVVAAYGLILPRAVLDAPRLGCLNVHASLLPRWRGAAPIQRALLAGDAETGVTVMRVVPALDAGPMLLREATPITGDDTAQTLHDRLAGIGARLIVDALAGVQAGLLNEIEQPERGVTYAAKLDKDEGRLDWTRPNTEVARAVRGYTPWPGAWFAVGGTRIKVTAAETVDADGEPGSVLDGALTVACGRGALRPLTVQRAGKAPMDAGAMLRGFPIPAGTRLD